MYYIYILLYLKIPSCQACIALNFCWLFTLSACCYGHIAAEKEKHKWLSAGMLHCPSALGSRQ